MTFYGFLGATMSKRVFILEIVAVCVIRLTTTVAAIGNSSIDDDYTPWSTLLEEATTLGKPSRNGRILLPTNYVQHNTFSPSQYYESTNINQFIPANNYYFSNRLDNVETIEYDSKPAKAAKTTTTPRPTTNSPSPPPPANPQPYQNYQPIRQNNYQQNLVPSQREISETDLFLLSAIEKLTYKVDYMEKRLKKTEQLLYYIMEGNQGDRIDTNPCPNNFSLIGDACFFIGIDRGLNWKSAAAMCKSLGGQLAELDPVSRQKEVVYRLLNDFSFRGKDFWVGGLNPGLLWIWINSGKPVNPNTKLDKVVPQRRGRIIVNENNVVVASTEETVSDLPVPMITEKEPILAESEESSEETEGKVINGLYSKGPTTSHSKIVNKPPTTARPVAQNPGNFQQNFKDDQIKGDGRCLRLSYNPSSHNYEYTGVDCVQRANYLCEIKDRTTENEISRIAKSLNFH